MATIRNTKASASLARLACIEWLEPGSIKRQLRRIPRWIVLSVLAVWMVPLLCLADDAITLPEGEGKKVFIALCSSCHQIEEVTKFSGYYGEEQWREVVLLMATYGIPFSAEQIPVLIEYLTENFGPKDR